MNNINKIKWIEKVLKKINPEITDLIKKENLNLVEDGYLDSLMILKLIFEIEKKTKRKINLKKLDREAFFSIKSISKLIK